MNDMNASNLRSQAKAAQEQAERLMQQARELEKAAAREEKEEERRKAVIREAIRLDSEIWKHFHPDYVDDGSCTVDDENIGMVMRADLARIICDADDADEAISYIEDKLMSSGYGEEIKELFKWSDVIWEAWARRDFAVALRNIKKGSELSGPLGWALSDSDVMKLTELHRSNRFRRKIEELLTDCNFHYECGMLHQKRYDELISGLGKGAA